MKTSSRIFSIFSAISVNGYVVQPIVGKSMWPLLRNRRDSVHIVCPDRDLKKGDIVLFIRKNEQNGHNVLHRIMGRQGDVFIICGDNQWYEEKVTEDMIIGVADGIYRDEKYISVNSRGYKIYLFFCMFFYPVRRPIYRFRDFCRLKIKGLISHK